MHHSVELTGDDRLKAPEWKCGKTIAADWQGRVFKDGVELVVDRFMLWTAKGTTGENTQGGN